MKGNNQRIGGKGRDGEEGTLEQRRGALLRDKKTGAAAALAGEQLTHAGAAKECSSVAHEHACRPAGRLGFSWRRLRLTTWPRTPLQR